MAPLPIPSSSPEFEREPWSFPKWLSSFYSTCLIFVGWKRVSTHEHTVYVQPQRTSLAFPLCIFYQLAVFFTIPQLTISSHSNPRYRHKLTHSQLLSSNFKSRKYLSIASFHSAHLLSRGDTPHFPGGLGCSRYLHAQGQEHPKNTSPRRPRSHPRVPESSWGLEQVPHLPPQIVVLGLARPSAIWPCLFPRTHVVAWSFST